MFGKRSRIVQRLLDPFDPVIDETYSCRGAGTEDRYLRLFPDGRLVGIVLDTPGILQGDMSTFSYPVENFLTGSYQLAADGVLSLRIVRAGTEYRVEATVDDDLDFLLGSTQEWWIRIDRIPRSAALLRGPDQRRSEESVDDSIVREWIDRVRSREQAARDWEAGTLLYSQDGHLFEMAGADLLCSGLVAELAGQPVIPVGRLGDTLQNVLYGSLSSLRNGVGYRHREQRLSRIALLVTKVHGWQPVELGGSGAHEQLDRFLRSPYEQMVLGSAIGSTVQDYFCAA